MLVTVSNDYYLKVCICEMRWIYRIESIKGRMANCNRRYSAIGSFQFTLTMYDLLFESK